MDVQSESVMMTTDLSLWSSGTWLKYLSASLTFDVVNIINIIGHFDFITLNSGVLHLRADVSLGEMVKFLCPEKACKARLSYRVTGLQFAK